MATSERFPRLVQMSGINRELGEGGGVLHLVNDGDDRRIFLGLKFLIPGFFWIGKLYWMYLYG